LFSGFAQPMDGSSWPEVARSALAVWVGAATHDIGFEKDPRNGKVTREMDPAVDGERANIGQTLHGPDKRKNLTDSLPSAPVQDAKKRQRRRMVLRGTNSGHAPAKIGGCGPVEWKPLAPGTIAPESPSTCPSSFILGMDEYDHPARQHCFGGKLRNWPDDCT
jgi:hypothetical protein